MPKFLKSIVADTRPRSAPVGDDMQGYAGFPGGMEKLSDQGVEGYTEPRIKAKNPPPVIPVETPPLAPSPTIISDIGPGPDKPAVARPAEASEVPDVIPRQAEGPVKKEIAGNPPVDPAARAEAKVSERPAQGGYEDSPPVPWQKKKQQSVQSPVEPEPDDPVSGNSAATDLALSPQDLDKGSADVNAQEVHPTVARDDETPFQQPLPKPEIQAVLQTDQQNDRYEEQHNEQQTLAARQPAETGTTEHNPSSEASSAVTRAPEPIQETLPIEDSDEDGQAITGVLIKPVVASDEHWRAGERRIDEKAATPSAETGPRVHIGQIDIIVQSETKQTAPQRNDRPAESGFSSRHYLRRLL